MDEATRLDVNDLWNHLKATIITLMQNHIPAKTINGNRPNKPWITSRMHTKRRRLRRLFKKSKTTGDHRDWVKYTDAKAATQKAERQTYWRYINSLIEATPGDDKEEIANSQKRFWGYIEGLRKDTTGVSPLKEGGLMYASSRDKANILNRQYKSVFTSEDLSDVPRPEGVPAPLMPAIAIAEDGVLQQINPSKASGPDTIPARLLKE